ncbi:PREDICTED: sodium channel and clathrin linker 1 [Propithecus coquereli]|uniref:sodium channel and clathrin linker 1 n=1 Tax=Propithecus coquereli TaxID=379532 RepID=UPI00063F6745|nr:PREDICTED: sodium channel and clathrin linker 1 [Propithecus coquereli]
MSKLNIKFLICVAPLITEYEKHLEALNGQLKYYQKQMGEMKLQLENVIKENERYQLAIGSFIIVLGNFYFCYLIFIPVDQLTNYKQLTKKLHFSKENTEMTHQSYIRTVTRKKVIGDEVRKLMQAKSDVRVAAAKVEELTKATEDLQGQMQKKEEDMVSAQGREEASDRRLQQLQTSIKQLETRLCVVIQEANQLRAEKNNLEKQTRDLQAKCNELENEKYEAIIRARNSMQLLEEANLQKNQVRNLVNMFRNEMPNIPPYNLTVRESIAVEQMHKNEIITSTKKQYNIQISRLSEELSALQMECAEKQGQIERTIKEKKAVEEELEKVKRKRKYNYLKPNLFSCSSEEISRSQEMIQKLQNVLESERKNCGFVSEQRLKLQQENEQLQKETENLRKIALEAQKTAKLKISTMEHEFSIKEHGYEVQLREMEDSNRNSTIELRHLLATQQKAANRWKEETKKLTESAEIRISNLKMDLSLKKTHTQESQIQIKREKMQRNEKLILEHQEKANRLQRRLSQAEERAASASQQLSVITVQRRKAASMMNLENI